MADPLSYGDTLTHLDLLVERRVSVMLGPDTVGTPPLLLVHGILRRGSEGHGPRFAIAHADDDDAVMWLHPDSFKSAIWREDGETLTISTTAGLLQITTRHVSPSPKR